LAFYYKFDCIGISSVGFCNHNFGKLNNTMLKLKNIY